jgi:cell growth-regulating nucleolar protein
MVWFDCSCGESIKKPSIAKHFLSRPCQTITCVDCNTQFDRQTYTAHTKCISEAQKYQGALYQASAKQEGAKQDRWLENLTIIVGNHQGPLKPALTRLLQMSNVPRKEKPFLAFCANSLGVRDKTKSAAIWALIKPDMWKGWSAEMEAMLKGGSLHWKKLRDMVVARFREFHPNANMKEEVLKRMALAELKEDWIEDGETVMVRL